MPELAAAGSPLESRTQVTHQALIRGGFSDP